MVQECPDGTFTVSIDGDIPDDLERVLLETAKTTERRETMRAALQRHRLMRHNSISPAARGEKFAVPRLCLFVQGKFEFIEEELILDLGEWTLNNYPAELTPTDFSVHDSAERWEVDLSGEKVIYSHIDQSIQLELGLLKLSWTDRQLSRWLDKECRQPDITQPVLLEFCRKVIAHLIERRGMLLNDLLRFKFQLAKAVQQKIKAYRKQAYAEGYQTFLFGPQAQVQTSFQDDFAFTKDRPYPAAWSYNGPYQFKNHFFGTVGELDSKGEEFECARLIDTLPQIKHWIRNLANRPQTSFWLPTATDRFYPDFIAELKDGRVFVVEYKGAHLADTLDTKEKQNIGELWAVKSGGKGIFLMAEKQNAIRQALRDQLLAAIR
jgi:type III restriction enzyme